jgi:hypothetical protein
MRVLCIPLALALLAGCQPMNPSGDVLAPVRLSGQAPAASGDDDAPEVAHDGFVFDAAEGNVDAPVDTDAPVDAAALFEEMGLGTPDEFGAEAGDAVDESPASSAPAAPAAPAAGLPPLPLPTQASAMVSGLALPVSWGVRLVSTTHGAQPPRGILGLPDGSERVVQPGDLLPEAGVIVLAVGKNRVQIAQVTPMGDHAGVQSAVLEAMYPTD